MGARLNCGLCASAQPLRAQQCSWGWAEASRLWGSTRNPCCGIQWGIQTVATGAGLGLVAGQRPFERPFASADSTADGLVVPLVYGAGWASPGWRHLAIATAGPFPCGPLVHGPAGYHNRSRGPGRWSFGSCGHCGGSRCGQPSSLAGGVAEATPGLPWIVKTGAGILAWCALHVGSQTRGFAKVISIPVTVAVDSSIPNQVPQHPGTCKLDDFRKPA